MKTVDEIVRNILTDIHSLRRSYLSEESVYRVLCHHIYEDRSTMVSYIEHLRNELGEEHPDGIKKKAV